MPWTYQIFASHRVIYSRMTDTVTAADFLAARAAAAADAQFDDQFAHLVDLRDSRLELQQLTSS